jgi:hypothetical protein
MLRKLGLVLPLVLVLITSGCSQLCVIPIPGICNGGTTEFTHDVIVIKSLEALPNKVSPGQQIKLQSYIENVGNKKVDGIEVNLYDHCGSLFVVNAQCPGVTTPPASPVAVCKDVSLLPHQTKSVSWTLTSEQSTKLLTECKLRIYANYSYETDSVTSITFIDYDEYQKMLDEGTFTTISSYITEGYGPIKPYLTVEDPQPVPVAKGRGGTITLGFQLKNKGNGFLSGSNTVPYSAANPSMDATKIANVYDIVTDVGAGSSPIPTGATNVHKGLNDCLKNMSSSGFTLIDKESPKVICSIPLPDKVNLPKQSTIHVTTQIEYKYEFRKDILVTVEPKT